MPAVCRRMRRRAAWRRSRAKTTHSLMRRQVQAKKWTPQQMVYINQLHLTVVMLLTGRIKLVEKADPKDGKPAPDKEVVVAEEPEKAAQTCTAEQKEKVKELIAAYVKTGPLAANTPRLPQRRRSGGRTGRCHDCRNGAGGRSKPDGPLRPGQFRPG